MRQERNNSREHDTLLGNGVGCEIAERPGHAGRAVYTKSSLI